MSLLIGLIPAIAWGLMPLLVSKIGGQPANQILGTTAGTFLIAFISLFFYHQDISATVFVLSILSGALWGVGQIGQYTAFTSIGVSKTMPISTGLQLVGTSLIGVFIFHEWQGAVTQAIGFTALASVIIGIYLTTLSNKSVTTDSLNKKTLLLLFLTNFGFLAYTSIPAATGKAGMAIFFPQALGMLIAAISYVVFSGKSAVFRQKTSWLNMLPGLLFATAALTYIISAQSNGIATGFVLSQLSVVISTLGAVFILKEKKTHYQMVAIVIGLILIVAGSSVTAMLRG